jgi:hypothetical protein
MKFLFWLWLAAPFWVKQNTAMRVEHATLTVGNRQFACAPNQIVNLPAMPPNVRIQTVSFSLELAAGEREWAELQNSRKMPIMFKWFRFSGARMFITSVAQDSNAARMMTAARVAGGTVVHQAHASNDRITSGTWVITPVYADNTPIIINGRELSFQFQVP